MKKTIILFLLVITSVIVNPISVYADVIWEPVDDFYSAHYSECEIIERTFIAASSSDATNIYVSPEDGTIVDVIKNGDEIFVVWGWKDWYYYDYGWIHSDDVAVVYDNIAFLNDNETTEYNSNEGSIPVAQVYSYPNSGDSYELIESKEYELIGSSFSVKYVDDAGLTWGYINYYMQHSGWVCIDDPTNTMLNTGTVATEQSVSQIRGSDAVPATASNNSTILIIATILIVLICTVTLLLLLKKKKVK